MLKPIYHRILLEPEPIPEKTETGIYLPNELKEKPRNGTVIAVADKEDNYLVGLNVQFRMWSGYEVTHERKKYLILDKEDVLTYAEKK